jgi:hypothetical protein
MTHLSVKPCRSVIDPFTPQPLFQWGQKSPLSPFNLYICKLILICFIYFSGLFAQKGGEDVLRDRGVEVVNVGEQKQAMPSNFLNRREKNLTNVPPFLLKKPMGHPPPRPPFSQKGSDICRDLMKKFIETKPEVWNEDIGQE